MSTAIEWVRNTDATQGRTWNPVVGCTHVSEGCDHCYAATLASGRLKTHPLYAGLAEGGKFTGLVRLVPERLEEPLHVRKPTTWFVNSMSDLFHDDVPDEFIAQVFAVMGYAQRHTFQVLTKRPGRMASLVGSQAFLELVAVVGEGLEDDQWVMHDRELEWQLGPWPLSNVWLGTSVETQKWAKVRVPKLLETPAAVRFLSCEPLLGPITLPLMSREGGGRCPHCGTNVCATWTAGDLMRCGTTGNLLPTNDEDLHWVIVGGESGPGARPMHPDWARSLRDQCVDAGVPFFFKQWGEWTPDGAQGTGLWNLATGEQILDVPMRHAGKKAAGRALDGRTWDEMPGRDPA